MSTGALRYFWGLCGFVFGLLALAWRLAGMDLGRTLLRFEILMCIM
jgi:hypothetical protein